MSTRGIEDIKEMMMNMKKELGDLQQQQIQIKERQNLIQPEQISDSQGHGEERKNGKLSCSTEDHTIVPITDSKKNCEAKMLNDQPQQNEIQKLSESIDNLTSRFNALEELVYNIDYDLDKLEQYSRRNCLLLHGCKDSDVEKLKPYQEFEKYIIGILNQKLNCNLNSYDIDITHILPQVKRRKRSIIIKFTRRSIRNMIFGLKKNLKGTGFSITESLTKRRISLMDDAKEKFGSFNVWSLNGEIYANNNGKKFHIRSRHDLSEA